MFKTINSYQGLSHNSPLSFLRDSKGFIWIGTVDGLNRYDGYSFRIFKNIPLDSASIRNNNIINLSEDYNKNIWIGAGSYLEIYNPQTETIQHADSIFNNQLKFEKGSKWKLHKDRFNNYWYLNTSQGLYKYYPENDSLLNVIKKSGSCSFCSQANLCDLTEDTNGDILVINSAGKIYKIKNQFEQVVDSISIQNTINNILIRFSN